MLNESTLLDGFEFTARLLKTKRSHGYFLVILKLHLSRNLFKVKYVVR